MKAFGKIKVMALGAACVFGLPTVGLAQTAKAGVVTTLQGTATVARATTTQPEPLKFKDDVFIQDQIVTGDRSTVRILLGGKAVVTIRERSVLTIHEAPQTSTIELSSGKIALAVAKDRMKPGESVQIKTPNAIAGVRGTVVIADVAPPAKLGGPVSTRFTLLTGIVDVSQLDAPFGGRTGQEVLLRPLQTVEVIGLTPPGAVRSISRADADSIASDYKVTFPGPPPSANTEVTAKLIEIAEQQTAALLNTRGETSKDAKDAKDAKDTKDVSDPKDTKDVKDVKDVKDTKDVKPVKVDAKVDTKATGIAAGGSVTVGGSTVGGGTTVGGGSTGVTVGGGTTTTPPPTTGPISGVIGKLPKLK